MWCQHFLHLDPCLSHSGQQGQVGRVGSGGQQSPKHTAVLAYGQPVGSSFLLWAPALGALSSQGTDRSSSRCFLMLGHRELQAEAGL